MKIEDLHEALAKIRSADEDLLAFTAVLAVDGAAEAARRARGPIGGKLVAIKDIFDTADLPTAYGSPIYEGHRPAMDAASVSLVREAGGVVVGKSVTTEFAFLEPSKTRNPAAPGCTPGGSSSGSAAAVAAGLVDLAIGSQTGGSTVRPASYCGIAGFKPSFGVLPTNGMKCFSWTLDTVGLFARSVREVGDFASALTGQRLCADAPRAASAFTVGIPRDYPWGDLSPSTAKAMAHAEQVLLDAGVKVRHFDMPGWVGEAFMAHDAIQGWEACRALAREFDAHPDALSPLLRNYLVGAQQISDESYVIAQNVAAHARRQCRDWLPGIDVMLTPSAPDEAPEGYSHTGASTFNRAWTLLGAPSLNVPGIAGVHGRPMGVQVLAPAGEDRTCLGFGILLEQLLGGSRS